MDPLARAAEAVERGDHGSALGFALAAWRARRAPELAEVIEALGAMLPPATLPTAPTATALRAALEDRAAADDAVDLAALAAVRPPRSLDDAIRWWRILAQRSPDPRLASWLQGVMTTPPFGRGELWTVTFELLVEIGDPRSIAWLEGFGSRLAEVARPSVLEAAERSRKRAIAGLREQFPQLPSLDLAARTQIAKLRAALERAAAAEHVARRDGDALLADVRANPGDDRPRLVYADWLQERCSSPAPRTRSALGARRR